jgi:hypothetical protein
MNETQLILRSPAAENSSRRDPQELLLVAGSSLQTLLAQLNEVSRS